MRARVGAFVAAVAMVVVSAGFVTTLAARPSPPSVTVHEWGTFTSVAGRDGHAIEWAPFNGPQDLPCFVAELNPLSVKFVNFATFPPNGDPGLPAPDATSVPLNGWLPSLRASVRMETPVLYFYSPVDASVSVSVNFKNGLVSEWYPAAVVPQAPAFPNFSQLTGSIAWRNVEILPHAEEAFPTDSVKSHYYAARETDASPVRVNGQLEKFLFYRGLASFPVKLSATLGDNGAIAVGNDGPSIPNAIVFENDGRRAGYTITGPIAGGRALARPALSSSADVSRLRTELQQLLVDQGLYEREAKAMVETWRDSWFEPGLRIIYLYPRASVDDVLPVTMTPAPKKFDRVFVGRLEIITPEMEHAVAAALRTEDVPALMSFGRFLEPIANRVLPALRVQDQQTAMATLKEVAAKFRASATVCK